MPITNPNAPAASMTIRQHIATKAMVGLLASGKVTTISEETMKRLAKFSFEIAEQMIAEGQ